MSYWFAEIAEHMIRKCHPKTQYENSFAAFISDMFNTVTERIDGDLNHRKGFFLSLLKQRFLTNRQVFLKQLKKDYSNDGDGFYQTLVPIHEMAIKLLLLKELDKNISLNDEINEKIQEKLIVENNWTFPSKEEIEQENKRLRAQLYKEYHQLKKSCQNFSNNVDIQLFFLQHIHQWCLASKNPSVEDIKEVLFSALLKSMTLFLKSDELCNFYVRYWQVTFPLRTCGNEEGIRKTDHPSFLSMLITHYGKDVYHVLSKQTKEKDFPAAYTLSIEKYQNRFFKKAPPQLIHHLRSSLERCCYSDGETTNISPRQVLTRSY